MSEDGSYRRRAPQQDRSRQTVEAILEAAAQILTEEGIGNLSTNKIAARAGVSVGSLYQYFGNKEAVLLALCERFVADIEGLIAARLSSFGEKPLAEAIEELIVELLAFHEGIDAEVSRVVFTLLLQHEGGALHDRWLRQMEGLVEAALIQQTELGAARDPAMVSFVLVNAFDGVIHAAKMSERPILEDSEALARELSALILRYLGLAPVSGP